jgi:EAL domain-containing protein (putative c-di-GMP-specific phosphodiesterase class I)
MIEQALREPAIDRDIEVVFQPIFKLDSLELHAFEALARWRHPEMGWISPAEFIPITEKLCELESISDALFRRALEGALAWPDSIKLSFNLSAVQLCSPGTARRTLSVLDEWNFDPCRLQIEVTETALLQDLDVARDNLSALRGHGISIVLDDFGAGYSSIAYLRQMEFEAIKLDGSLVTAATDHHGGLALLRGVILLCNSIGLPCVAEHIETEKQLAELRRLGCQFGQGFLLSRPLGAAAAAQLAATRVGNALERSAA